MHERLLRDWEQEAEELDRSNARQVSPLAITERFRGVSTAAVVAAIPQGAVLLDVIKTRVGVWASSGTASLPSWQDLRYVALVVPGSRPDDVKVVDLGPAEEIDGLIENVRQAITGEQETRIFAAEAVTAANSAPADFESAAQALADAVVTPVARSLKGHGHLLVSPDGDLTRIPLGNSAYSEELGSTQSGQPTSSTRGGPLLCATYS